VRFLACTDQMRLAQIFKYCRQKIIKRLETRYPTAPAITAVIMARQRTKKIFESRETTQDTKPKVEEFHDFNASDASDEENVEMMDRDEEEDELERLVLGDSADFMQQIEHEAQQNLEDISEGDEEEGNGEESDADEGLEAVNDADVGFDKN
jgi:hypothetical protein